MSIKDVFLIGSGGHASVVLDALICGGAGSSVTILDSNPERNAMLVLDKVVRAPFSPSALGSALFHVAIGENKVRQSLFNSIMEGGSLPLSVIHPAASLSRYATVDPGCFVAAGTIVGPRATVGRGVIINHSAVVDHDCEIMEFCHIAPGAVLGGSVNVGESSLIGANATILPGVRIGANVIVGAGSTVTKDIPCSETWVGTPAFKKESKENA